jgi:RNA polymerase sigma factor (sigma-70 family)
VASQQEAPAIRAIIQTHNRRLYRVARSVVRDDGEAEDVLQEAYFRAFAALAEFRGDSSFATRLGPIVLNEALQRVRCRTELPAAPTEPTPLSAHCFAGRLGGQRMFVAIAREHGGRDRLGVGTLAHRCVHRQVPDPLKPVRHSGRRSEGSGLSGDASRRHWSGRTRYECDLDAPPRG